MTDDEIKAYVEGLVTHAVNAGLEHMQLQLDEFGTRLARLGQIENLSELEQQVQEMMETLRPMARQTRHGS